MKNRTRTLPRRSDETARNEIDAGLAQKDDEEFDRFKDEFFGKDEFFEDESAHRTDESEDEYLRGLFGASYPDEACNQDDLDDFLEAARLEMQAALFDDIYGVG